MTLREISDDMDLEKKGKGKGCGYDDLINKLSAS